MLAYIFLCESSGVAYTGSPFDLVYRCSIKRKLECCHQMKCNTPMTPAHLQLRQKPTLHCSRQELHSPFIMLVCCPLLTSYWHQNVKHRGQFFGAPAALLRQSNCINSHLGHVQPVCKGTKLDEFLRQLKICNNSMATLTVPPVCMPTSLLWQWHVA